jgi:hypothetical protein
MEPVSSRTVPSIVSVPASSANLSVVDVFVVQFPSLVVERVVVVVIGPVGLSLADTVTVLDDVHVRRLQLSSGISVSPSVTEKSAPIVIVPVEAQPNSSEMTVKRADRHKDGAERACRQGMWRRGRDSNPRCRLPHMAV